MKFALSTSWNSSRHDNGFDIVNEIKAAGFDTIELNFTLTKKVVDDIIVMKKRAEIAVSSLHNICPLPEDVTPSRASPDHYSLASPDPARRERAVEVTKNTISCAKTLGARAVVLHIGRVEIKDRMREIADAVRDRNLYEKLKRVMAEERSANKAGYLDNAIASLDELIGFAKGHDIALGVENRYYYREIPLIEELEEVFRVFKRGDLFYWHDVGHAQVFENLGLARQRDYLEKFAHRLIGVHLHDIISPIDDHQLPGRGTFDFSIIKPYLTSDTIRVVEVHGPVGPEDIRQSVEHLARLLD